LVGAWVVVAVGGCVSLSEYQRLQAKQRSALADKTALEQELFDVRTANDSLRTRVGSLDSEIETKGELLANLKKEIALLEEMRRTSQSALEEMANKQALGDITISGPKLPEALDTALKQFADQHPSAVYDSTRGTIKWKADLLFAIGSDVVKDSSIDALQSFTQVIMSPAAADFEVLVVGHTDTQPIVRAATKAKHPTNWHLSAHRAIAVAFALQKYGYAAGRVGVVGYGEYRPVTDNATEAGKSQNRRVEIYLVPRGAIVQASAGAGWKIDGQTVAVAPLSR
jgi:chemotaxis protein MotB